MRDLAFFRCWSDAQGPIMAGQIIREANGGDDGVGVVWHMRHGEKHPTQYAMTALAAELVHSRYVQLQGDLTRINNAGWLGAEESVADEACGRDVFEGIQLRIIDEPVTA